MIKDEFMENFNIIEEKENVMETTFDWDSVLGPETDDSEPEVQRIKLNKKEQAVIFIKELFKVAAVHLVKADDRGFYALCTGSGCPLCGMGNERKERLFLPAYCTETGVVGVVQSTTSRHPGSLPPQIRRSLGKTSGRVLLFVSTIDNIRFKVRSQELQPGDDNGAEAIEEFLEKSKSGEVDILSVCPTYSQEELEDMGVTSKVCKR